jgi:hypothetical protein
MHIGLCYSAHSRQLREGLKLYWKIKLTTENPGTAISSNLQTRTAITEGPYLASSEASSARISRF